MNLDELCADALRRVYARIEARHDQALRAHAIQKFTTRDWLRARYAFWGRSAGQTRRFGRTRRTR